ncbi:hypothetical protein WJX79_009705 [Trebouxia sp. C0005]
MKFPPGYVPGSGVHKASGFGGFGERLLRKQGWEKGEGLGKNKSGVAEAIQVKKKEDTAGVGANRSHINSDKWWEGAFNAAVHSIDHEDSDSDSDSAAEAADSVPVVTKKRIVVEPVFTATVPAVPFVQTPSAGWWGAKKFKSAGCLEGIDKQQKKAQSERQQFDEDDQANLYMAAQNLKTSGKKGLGTKSHIGMVAGAKWEGSKTVFHDDANDASQDPERRQAASRQDVALASLPQVVHQDQPDHVSESQDDLPKKKWKKMALAELQKADQKQMKLKSLQKVFDDSAVFYFAILCVTPAASVLPEPAFAAY